MQNFSHTASKDTVSRTGLDEEAGLAARAAWLYFSAGMTQGQIAKRLGVPATKAHRLIARATREGLVRIFVDASVSECSTLEERLSESFGLEFCRVAPDLGEENLPLKALGLAGATFLRLALESGEHEVIGIGHGRTLAAAVHELPTMRKAKGVIVSLLGGLTRKFAANPFDVIHRLAEKTGTDAYLMPVPLYANTAGDRDVLMAQMGVEHVFEMCRAASLLLMGIGEVGSAAHLSEIGTVTPEEMDDLKARGAVGEILGHYLDADGQPIASSLATRLLSLPLDEISGRMSVGIGGGPNKVEAIRSVLNGGHLKGLITDEVTARRLVEDEAAS